MTEENEELIKSTLNLLQNRSAKLMLLQINAELTEGEKSFPKKERISYEWLKKFHQGKFDEPRHPKVINKIERLHKYLVSKLNPTLT